MRPQLPTPGGRVSIYALSLVATAQALAGLVRSHPLSREPIFDSASMTRGSPKAGPSQARMELWYTPFPH